jgi:1-acyl-sn-glycerol-3-phosphate acyltransferase
MLDLARMRRIQLRPRPWAQAAFAQLVLRPAFAGGRVQIDVEGLEGLPQDRGVFVAMNHPDRYNYLPLQVLMHRRGMRALSSWVKPRYFEKGLVGAFMEATGNIPLPSRGYVLACLFRGRHRRPPDPAEYRALRDCADGRLDAEAAGQAGPAVRALVAGGGWADELEARFSELALEVARLTREALASGLHVQVFPEGTRSVRMGRGRTGLAQMVQHLGAEVVPVGCSGSHRLFPGDSPWPRPGRVVYRMGPPMGVDHPRLAAARVPVPFVPFSREASRLHGAAFQAWTDAVMEEIAARVDPEHRPDPGSPGEGPRGAERFL